MCIRDRFSTQLVRHFFETLASNAKITIHASVYGDNDHHKIEALFKAFAYAMKRAVKIEGKDVKSTKGTLYHPSFASGARFPFHSLRSLKQTNLRLRIVLCSIMY